MNRNPFLALTLIPLIAACAAPATRSGSAPVATTPPPSAPAPIRPQTGFIPARIMNLPGLEGVIGVDADGLVRQFGRPRLDVWEDDARKLQFAGGACVLDVYLYPPAPGQRETAAYVDARRSDGLDVDRAACVQALRR